MDRIRAARLRRANVLLGVEIRDDLDLLAGAARVERARVVRRHDRDRVDAERTARSEDAHCDLATVRDE